MVVNLVLEHLLTLCLGLEVPMEEWILYLGMAYLHCGGGSKRPKDVWRQLAQPYLVLFQTTMTHTLTEKKTVINIL